MNTKYVLALILALQVSMSLCEIREPSQEVVDRYNDLKATFMKRLMNAMEKVQAAAAPHIDTVRGATGANVGALQEREEYKAFVQVANNVMAEGGPYVDRARSALLGAYEEYIRPTFQQHMNDGIEIAKAYLDKVMPAQ
uniref:Apolipoprotein A-II n=1 Tax=Stegastes partitus TaxID=144197 RepID=A0A3B5A9L6_9TELE